MRPRVATFVLVACLVLAHATNWAQSSLVTRGDSGRVTVHAESAPLGQLLRELAALTPMDLRVDPAAEGAGVSVDLTDVPIERAIYAVLQESGVNTVVVGLYRLSDDVRIRVVAGNPKAAVTVAGLPFADGDKVSASDTPLVTPPLPSDEELRSNKPTGGEVPSEEVDGGGSGGSNTPGAVTAEAWIQAVFPNGGVRPVRAGATMLPFVGEDGRPVVEMAPPGPRTQAMLPFVDEVGLPIVLPIQPRSDGMVMLPFVDERGQPVLVPAAPATAPGSNPVPGRRPGPGGLDR